MRKPQNSKKTAPRDTFYHSAVLAIVLMGFITAAGIYGGSVSGFVVWSAPFAEYELDIVGKPSVISIVAGDELWSNPLFTLYPEIGPSHMKKSD